MTFDREPDLDNANVGMPDTRILGITKYIKEVTKSVASFFVVFGGVFMVKINGEELNIAGKTVAEYLASTALPDEYAQIVAGWAQCKRGRYILERHLKKGSVFISAENGTVYMVKGFSPLGQKCLAKLQCCWTLC